MRYQKDFYSLNYNLRLTHPLSVTIMGNRAHIIARKSFIHFFNCYGIFHFYSFLIFSCKILKSFRKKKPLRLAEALIVYFKFDFQIKQQHTLRNSST